MKKLLFLVFLVVLSSNVLALNCTSINYASITQDGYFSIITQEPVSISSDLIIGSIEDCFSLESPVSSPIVQVQDNNGFGGFFKNKLNLFWIIAGLMIVTVLILVFRDKDIINLEKL